MTQFDLAIRGGTIVTASDEFRADIGIRDGRIVGIADRIEGAAREIDATGLLALPGGIDSHVHISQASGPDVVMADDFASATRAAAAGGNTMVLPFALQIKGTSLRACVEDYRKLAEGECYIDTAFHLIISDPTAVVLGQELPALVKDGYTSFKVFMTYDDLVLSDRQLLEVFEVARREEALVMVHCEGYDAIRHLTARLEREGHIAPYFHGVSRPQAVEREATHRAISHAEIVGVPIMIVHVSGREAMEQVRWAQQRGLPVHAETCPQYITLTADDMKGLNMDIVRREICLLAAAARQGKPAGDLGRHHHGRVPDLLVRSLPVPLRRSQGQADAEWRAPRSAGCRTEFRASRRGCRSCSRKAYRRDGSACRNSSS